MKSIRPYSNKVFDVHLMIAPADPYIKGFADAGADIITVHVEAGNHLHRSLQLIKSLGKKAGVSLCPATPVAEIENVMDIVDLVLVMSVKPGFGGQSFINSTLNKISQIRTMIDKTGRDIDLEVDGGVTSANAGKIISAGADVLVAGSAIFTGNQADYAKNINKLRTNNQ